ncbi:MAG: hypothetical protein U5J98_06630 [Halobacteriales archaeon]|nr:hypothetical protein [Halobacteriales archaeon]
MGILRNGVIVLLVVLLAVNLAAANALVAADRTVLNPGFVTTTLEEEGAYEQAQPIVLEQLPTEQLEGEDAPPLPIDPQTVAATAVDAAYLQSQIEPNIERTYAYLHGNSDELELVIDLEPAKDAIAAAVEAELTNASPTELVDAIGGSEDLSFEAQGVTIELSTVAEMAESESTFDAERAELRATIRERVLDQLVNQTFAEASNDELLALVIDDYDPNEYNESEKEQLVDDNEDEIRTALRDRIESERGGEIDAAVEEQLSENRELIRTNAAQSINESLSDVSPAVREPAVELVLVAVDGYVADVSHDEFSASFDAAADDLAAGITTLLEAELDEQVPDTLDLTEQLDSSAMQSLEDARQAVGLIDLLSIGLPALGAVLIGLIFLASRSVAVTGIGAGIGLTIGGLPPVLGTGLVRARLEEAIASAELPAAMGDLVLAVVGQVTDAVFLQSAIVTGVGVVVLAAGLALQFGIVSLPGGRE